MVANVFFRYSNLEKQQEICLREVCLENKSMLTPTFMDVSLMRLISASVSESFCRNNNASSSAILAFSANSSALSSDRACKVTTVMVAINIFYNFSCLFWSCLLEVILRPHKVRI